MGDFGDDSIDASGKKAGLKPGSEPENHTHEHNQDRDNIDGNEQNAKVSPVKLVAETSMPTDKSQQRKLADLSLGQKALDFLPVILDAVMVQARPREKSYSMVVDLDAEVARKLANAPDPVKEFYKEMRQAQMDHQSIGLEKMRTLNPIDAAAYKDKWAEMNAWLAFPEEDKDCEEGRKSTEEYVKRRLDRNGAGAPNDAEQEKDNRLLAKIFSLMQNDHDYLHNEDELTRRNGMHHLPEAFVGIGMDKQAKTFNLKELAEQHMFDILQNSYKSPLKPDERANLAFYSQVLRQVLPAELLDDAHKGERDKILKDYVAKYALRDKDLSGSAKIVAQGKSIWQIAMENATVQYPEMAKIKPGLQLTDAESLYEFFTLTDIRQLAIEAHEMRTLYGNLGKESELAYPDQARLYELSQIKAPMREYREGQTLFGKRYLSGVFEPAGKRYLQLDAKEKLRLGNWPGIPAQIIENRRSGVAKTVINPAGIYQDWQTVYWNDNPNRRESQIQKEIIMRFPRSLQCSLSNEGADLLRRWKGPQGLFGNQSDRLVELSASLRDAATKQPCIHDNEPRKKGKIN